MKDLLTEDLEISDLEKDDLETDDLETEDGTDLDMTEDPERQTAIEKQEKPDEQDEQEEQEAREERIRKREEERIRKREKRKRQVLMQKIAFLMLFVLIICAGIGVIVRNVPSAKLSRRLSQGDRYTAEGDYEKAQVSYQEAIKLKPDTVKAYRSLAQNYLEQDDREAAREILYTGWEATQDESLLHFYCTVILNEAVAEINAKSISPDTIDKCIQVLQIEPDNEDAISLLHTCYDRFWLKADEDDKHTLFMDQDTEAETCLYHDYERQLRSLLAVYESDPSDALSQILTKYAVIDVEFLYLSVAHLESYHRLIESVKETLSDDSVTDLGMCLAEAINREKDFEGIFAEFEQGNFESARDFIISDTYVKIRDAFINSQSGYWEGSAAIPINREQMVIHKTEDGFRFSWLGYDDYENSKGVITVWGSRLLDDGVQRTTISYEPPGENGTYYPHTEYIIAYEYSNVLENGTDVRMNYRLETKVTTKEGTTTQAIGDWGGQHEWETEY